ncbi:MAG: DinB family protein [Ferruginibacter sp.]
MPDSIVTSKPGYYRAYLDQVKEKDLTDAFTNQSQVIKSLLASISENKSMFSYAEGKWTLKEMLQHLIDTERVFCYRAMCFARKEPVTLPSFDENGYATASEANRRSWESLIEEFETLRKSTLLLFQNFTPSMLEQEGRAGINTLAVNDIGFLIVGHLNHHIRIIEERYLVKGL